MHYKNGRKAEVGDKVIGLTYNKPGAQIGIIASITPGQTTCNCSVDLPSKTHWGTFEREYTQLDWLLHADDVWSFVIGIAYSPSEQDYFAKVQNFSHKWNAPIQELSPSERPILTVKR